MIEEGEIVIESETMVREIFLCIKEQYGIESANKFLEEVHQKLCAQVE